MAGQPDPTGHRAQGGRPAVTWWRLSLEGSWRRPARTLIAAAGVALAVAIAFCLISFQRGYQRSLRHDLDQLGAHILVVPKGCPYDAASLALHGANWPCHLKESYANDVRGIAGIATVAPVLMTAIASSVSKPEVFVGIDTNMPDLKKNWQIDGRLPGPGEILVGALRARSSGWVPGATVEVPGLRPATRRISGVLQPTGSSDDGFLFLPLREAQTQFGHPGELTHLLVRLRDPNRLDSAVAALRGCDAGMHMNIVPVAHLFRTIQSLVNTTRGFLAAATLIAFLVAGAGVSAALLLSIAERTREIGMLRAIGASRAHLAVMVGLEAIQTCLLGAASGVLIAFLATRTVETWLRARLPFAPAGAIISWEWPVAVLCLVVAVLLGSFAAALPASRAARLPPVLAMRGQLTA